MTITEELVSLSIAKPFLAREFLTWLWHLIEKNHGAIQLSNNQTIEMWIDDKLTLESTYSESKTNQLSGGNPAGSIEASAALKSGKLLKEAKLGIRTNDREWVFSLRSDDFITKGLKLPSVITSEEERTIERLRLLNEFQNIVDDIYQQFFQIRTSDTWSKIQKELGGWIQTKGEKSFPIPTNATHQGSEGMGLQ